MFPIKLPLNCIFQDLLNGILYFVAAWNFIDFDKLNIWFYILVLRFGFIIGENPELISQCKLKPKF